MANQLQLRRGTGTPITAGFISPLEGEPFVSTNGGGFYISTGTTGADYKFIGGTGLLSPADAGVGSRLTLKQDTGVGTNFVAWQAPDTINNSYIVSMPAAVGAQNEILKISGAPTTGRILSISGVTTAGTGYTDGVSIATIGTGTGGVGSGGTARVIIDGGQVVAAYLLDPGSAYATGTNSTLDVGGNTSARVSILEVGSEVQLVWDADAGGSATTLNTQDASEAGQTASGDFFPTFVDSNNAGATAESFYTESNFAVQPDVGLIKVGNGGGITQLGTGDATTNFATEVTGTANTKTVNIGTGAAADSTLTDINIGSTTANQTIDIADGDSGSSNTKTVNIARGATSNTGATSNVNIGVSTGAGTTRIYSRDVQIGNEWTGAQTVDIATAATLNTVTKTVNIGTGGATGSTSNVTIGSTIAGTTTVDSPTLQASNGVITTTITNGTAAIFNTSLTSGGTLNVGNTAGTVAFGNAATSFTAGSTATTGNTTTNVAVRALTSDSNTVNIATGGANGGTVVVNLGSTNATSSTVNINGNLNVTGTTTTINTQDLTVVDKTIIVANNANAAGDADAGGLQVGGAGTAGVLATWFFEDNLITTFKGAVVTEDAWESSLHINLAADKGLFLAGTEVVTYNSNSDIVINNAIIDGGTYN